MFKKFVFATVISSVMAISIASAAPDPYKACLDENYMDDRAMNTCNEEEYSRKIDLINNIANGLLSNQYYADWGYDNLSAVKRFSDMMKQWDAYSDEYCDLYSFSISQGGGTIYPLQISQCKVDMANKLLSDVNELVKIYKQSL